MAFPIFLEAVIFIAEAGKSVESIWTIEILAIFPYGLPAAVIAPPIPFLQTDLLNRIRAFTLWKEYENE